MDEPVDKAIEAARNPCTGRRIPFDVVDESVSLIDTDEEPLEHPVGVSLGALTVRGRMHLAVRYRHPTLGGGAAARFAERYLSTLERWPG